MTKKCDLIAFLYRIDDVNHLMRQLSEHVSTRSMWQRLTTSCRKWQLVLLCLLHADPRFNVISSTKSILGAILQQTESEYPTPIRALIVRNRPSLDEVSLVSNLDDVVWFDTQHPTQVACMCLYIVNYPELHRPDGCILHYFTLLKCANNRMYLNSSYASDYVCVSQCTNVLSRRVFDEFCIAITRPSENEIGSFFERFFIPSRLMQTRVESETERNHQTQTVDERIDSELRVYTHNLHKISVGQLSRYSHHLQDVVKSLHVPNPT
jgi:hypothetical protein